MIIAILQAGPLEGKIKLPNRLLPEVDIILPVMASLEWSNVTFSKELKTTPRARFIWYRQISKYKHLYKLKEIL